MDYYTETVKRLDILTEAFKAEWFKENKAFGWEIHEIRLAGIRARMLTCQSRIKAYLEGELDTIEELDKEVLPRGDRNGYMYHAYRTFISPCEL